MTRKITPRERRVVRILITNFLAEAITDEYIFSVVEGLLDKVVANMEENGDSMFINSNDVKLALSRVLNENIGLVK